MAREVVLFAILFCFCVAQRVPLEQPLYVQFTDDFPSVVRNRILSFLAPFNATVIEGSSSPPPSSGSVLGFGAAQQNTFCRPSFFSSLPQNVSEAFQVVQSSIVGAAGGSLRLLCAEGNAVFFPAKNSSVPAWGGRVARGGRVMASMALLKTLGFAFLHPLQPSVPSVLSLPSSFSSASVLLDERPFFGARGAHYHSEHPLDLTELFQGVDSPDRSWQEMLSLELDLYASWLAAHKVNRLEWVLLCKRTSSSDDCMSDQRTQRFAQIGSWLRQWGIAVFADIGLAIRQQHAMHMIKDPSEPLPQQLQDIRESVDWLLGKCGLDGISTEAGTSEFTQTACTVSLAWYNELSQYVSLKYPSCRTYIKMHVSTGQTCSNYTNPLSGGGPINFNFLPVYADKHMGVYPHTVQMYTVNDPTSGTYGNTNFSDILEIGLFSASQSRETLFYPENTYWINYDINVPLGLAPVYAMRSIMDIRIVANQQKASSPFAGTFLFESGWEYGYWLSAIVHYEASWNPRLSITDDVVALVDILSDLDNLFGSGWAKTIATAGEAMRWPLIFGVKDASSPLPPSTLKFNGMAYLQGSDTWSELSQMFNFGSTQPPKKQFYEMQLVKLLPPSNSDIINMFNLTVQTLQDVLDSFVSVFENTRSFEATDANNIRKMELLDCANITLQRGVQVLNLLQVASSGDQNAWQIALDSISRAQEIVARREKYFNVERIASWRPNPTSYRFTYLWTAKSLFFFWRDQQQLAARNMSSWTPCLMNIQDPVDVFLGPGVLDQLMAILRQMIDKGNKEFGECLSAPSEEPVYPQDAH